MVNIQYNWNQNFAVNKTWKWDINSESIATTTHSTRIVLRKTHTHTNMVRYVFPFACYKSKFVNAIQISLGTHTLAVGHASLGKMCTCVTWRSFVFSLCVCAYIPPAVTKPNGK